MGADYSQKLRPRRRINSPPGRSKPPVHGKINCNEKLPVEISGVPQWSEPMAQPQTAWVIFGEQGRVNSRKRRRLFCAADELKIIHIKRLRLVNAFVRRRLILLGKPELDDLLLVRHAL